MDTIKEVSLYYLHSPIGQIAIKATDEHIISIHFLKDGELVKNAISASQTPPLIQKCIAELEAYFKGDLQIFTFPYLQDGTAFRQKVWEELSKLAYGTTVSYLEISKRLGDVKAIRAAASANGKNQLAIVVPCHRVIGNDGSLTGYAGGLWRKKWLLEHEQKFGGGSLQLKIF